MTIFYVGDLLLLFLVPEVYLGDFEFLFSSEPLRRLRLERDLSFFEPEISSFCEILESNAFGSGEADFKVLSRLPPIIRSSPGSFSQGIETILASS